MNRFITKKNILLSAIILLIIIGVLAVWLAISSSNKSSTNDKPTQANRVSVDFSTESKLLTDTQKTELETTLLGMTTKETAKDAQRLNGKIRESSVQRISEREVLFIVDSAELQTSYLVTRFVSPTDNVDILYTVCVEESQKIYEKDYCLVE